MTANNTIAPVYVSRYHGVISHNPDQCRECEISRKMELITQEEAERLLKMKNWDGEYVYFNLTSLSND